MAKVICTLPNASGEISGIRFVKHKLGMVSEEIDDPQVVKDLLTIHGFHLHDPETGGPAGSAKPADDSSARDPRTAAGSGSIEATPEVLADAAKSFSVADRQKLIKLLIDQQPSTTSRPPASRPAGSGKGSGAAATTQQGSPPPAAPAQSANTDGSGAPSSTSTGGSPPKADETPAPQF